MGTAFVAERQHLYAVLPQHAHPEGGLEEEGGGKLPVTIVEKVKRKRKESLADLIGGWGVGVTHAVMPFVHCNFSGNDTFL